MSKHTDNFDLNEYYEAEYLDEFSEYSQDIEEEESDEEALEFDSFEEDSLYGDDSYESFKSTTSHKRNSDKKTKAPVKGTEVHKRFFQIMEDYHSGDRKRQQ